MDQRASHGGQGRRATQVGTHSVLTVNTTMGRGSPYVQLRSLTLDADGWTTPRRSLEPGVLGVITLVEFISERSPYFSQLRGLEFAR